MATRDSVMARGRRKGESAKQRFCDEIRIARIGLGLSQADASSRVGISRASWTRYESGERDVPSWDVAARMAAAVGLDLVVQLFPSERVLHDAPQVDLLGDLREILGPGWSWRYEVRVGAPPDQRAWDAVAEHNDTGMTIRVDAETRIADCQRILRRTRSKADAGGDGPVILAVRDSTRNRHALRASGDIMRSEFPVPMRAAVRALRRGLDPGGDAILLIRRRTADARRSRGHGDARRRSSGAPPGPSDG